jgi:transcriptional regulator with PAS, ATPase and Fis domain
MFKYTTHKLSILIKLLCLFGAFIFSFYYISTYLNTHLERLLQNSITFDFLSLLNQIPIQTLLISFSPVIIIFILILFDLITFTKEINLTIKESLEDRKLSNNFTDFYKNKSFSQVVKKLKNLLSLYKSFDNMKTARIVLESSTIKQLMNVVNEGLILVNKDFTVTHINHVAEKSLGLIPGEIIGQAISRKISNELILTHLEKAFNFDAKITDLKLEKLHITLSMSPLKDKFGDIIRTLVILKNDTSIKPTLENTEEN